MSTVHLRHKKGKKGHTYLYLEFYPPFFNPRTRKTLRYEFLHLSIYTEPKNPIQKNYNSEMLKVAEAIRCKRAVSIANMDYGFFDKQVMQNDFIEYFREKVKAKNQQWTYTCNYFSDFVHGKCKFSDITVKLAEDFREYLMNATSISSVHKSKVTLSRNTSSKYFSLFRNILRQAYKEQFLKINVSDYLDYIPREQAEIRQFLTMDEVRILYNTPCVYDILKNAAMFSIFTGLRFSDIYDLDWSHITTAPDGKPCIVKQIVKTRRNATIYISDEALQFCGERKEEGRVFPYLRKSMTKAPLHNWIKRSGIQKHITFHCFRHTNATLLASSGINIYTVKDQLVHTHVNTTEIYAKLLDTNKRAAAEAITLR